MTRLIPLSVVAEHLALAPSYVRRIAADQGRPEAERRYPAHVHETFPPFIKHGHGWKCIEQTFKAFMEQKQKTWEPRV